MDATARHALPLIAPGQAQKELTHNEALTLIDALLQPNVVATGATVPPESPVPGECWVLGAAPDGAWTGQGGRIACWSTSGWRFVTPREGMTVWTGGSTGFARHAGGEWSQGALVGTTVRLNGHQVVGARAAAVAAPTGGATVDAQSRAAIAGILAAMVGHGLIDG